MFSALAVGYLFLGGAGAGALTLLSICEFAEARRRFAPQGRPRPNPQGRPRQKPSATPSEFFSWCWSFCAAILVFGMLCLLVDLGRPERITYLLTSPTFSPIALGAYSLVGALVCAAAFMAVELSDTFRPSVAAVRVLSAAGIACGLVASTYTGVLLQSMASVVIWNSPAIPVLFLVSSLSTGAACLFVVVAFIEGRKTSVRRIVNLARIDTVLIVAEALCLAAFLGWASGSPSTYWALFALVAGEYAWLFWGGVVAGGLTVPLVLEWFISGSNYRMQVLWIAVFVLVGGLLLRICITGVGTYDITQIPEALYGLTGAAHAPAPGLFGL